jgi:ElaB/YqjD/DUF883 family membrane-anchored ribosome-binding protein
MNETPQGVATELEAIAADTRELLGETQEGLRHTVDRARHARHSAFVKLRRTGRAVGQQAADGARIAARATHHYIEDSPWRALEIAVVLGAALAYVFGRR